MLRSAADVARLPAGEAMLEALVDIDYELAIMIARDVRGNVALYPLTEILMDPQAHVMDTVLAPAEAPAAVAARCAGLAEAVVSALDYVGVLAIEFFVDKQGEVLVIKTTDSGGNTGERVLAHLTSQGKIYVAANHWPRAWYTNALANPEVEVSIEGNAGAYTAVPVSGTEHDQVDADNPLPAVFRFITGYPPPGMES